MVEWAGEGSRPDEDAVRRQQPGWPHEYQGDRVQREHRGKVWVIAWPHLCLTAAGRFLMTGTGVS